MLTLVDSPDPDPARLALEIARLDAPRLDPLPWLAELEALAMALRPQLDARADPGERIRQLVWFVGESAGFALDPAGPAAPENSYLHRVLERRRGIPITLAIVYLALATRVGLAAEGVNFPGYFLVRLGTGKASALVDPGVARTVGPEACETYLRRALGPEATLRPEHLVRADARAIAVRMLNNLRLAAAERKHLLEAIRYSGYLSALLPSEPMQYRDRASWYEQLGDTEAASREYEALLALIGESEARGWIEARLRVLSTRGPRGPVH